MVGDMRTDLCLLRSAGTCTLPLGSFIFYFESNFVLASGHQGLGLWLNACRYEDLSGATKRVPVPAPPLGSLIFLNLALCLPQGMHTFDFGSMVADMRTELYLPRSAGTGTFPLRSLIFFKV